MRLAACSRICQRLGQKKEKKSKEYSYNSSKGHTSRNSAEFKIIFHWTSSRIQSWKSSNFKVFDCRAFSRKYDAGNWFRWSSSEGEQIGKLPKLRFQSQGQKGSMHPKMQGHRSVRDDASVLSKPFIFGLKSGKSKLLRLWLKVSQAEICHFSFLIRPYFFIRFQFAASKFSTHRIQIPGLKILKYHALAKDNMRAKNVDFIRQLWRTYFYFCCSSLENNA